MYNGLSVSQSNFVESRNLMSPKENKKFIWEICGTLQIACLDKDLVVILKAMIVMVTKFFNTNFV